MKDLQGYRKPLHNMIDLEGYRKSSHHMVDLHGLQKYIYRWMAVCTAAVLLFLSLPLYCATATAATHNGSGIVTNNIHDHNYEGSGRIANSYLVDNGNGTFSRVENMGDIILVETYNGNFQMIRQRVVALELSKFGGLYSDGNNNFLIFGQDNPSNSYTCEVLRVVKYTKDWERVSSASLSNCNTNAIFTGANLDCSLYNGMLYIRCGHTMYNGVQANMTVAYQISTNKITDVENTVGTQTGNIAGVGVTYIDAGSGTLYAADATISNPYALNIFRYNSSAGATTFRATCAKAQCLGSVGALGATTPVFSLGGLEASGQYALAVGTTASMDGRASNQNVFVAAVPKGNVQNGSVMFRYMTGYSGGSIVTCTNPYIVKISLDRFMVLWETRNGYTDNEKVSYVMIDGSGNKVTEVKQVDGCLSDCQPILFQGKVVWYTTNGANMRFYSIAVPGAGQSTAAATQYIYRGVNYAPVFDFSYYCNRYPDIRVLFANNPQGALQHFVTCGMAEGRQGSDNFNVNVYRSNYPDLQQVFGTNLPAYYMHFLTNGYLEGRNARTAL